MKTLKRRLLAVGDGHRINYEVCGNKKGVPFISFHGGPGGSFSESHKKFFDSKKNKVVFFDQRGCGKSKYKDPILANTTAHLVEDTKKLLDHLNIKKVNLFGCSWGSTLALCFAIKYPTYVNSIILNGVYLGTKQENDELYTGKLTRKFKEEIELIRAHIPKGKNNLKYAFAKITTGTAKEKILFTKLLLLIEICGMTLDMTWEKAQESIKDMTWSRSKLISPTYMVNNCYLPPNYIVKNAHKIRHIPTTIISGKQDLVCPPKNARRLKNALGEKCTLKMGEGAHSRREKAISKMLTSAVKIHTKKFRNKN